MSIGGDAEVDLTMAPPDEQQRYELHGSLHTPARKHAEPCPTTPTNATTNLNTTTTTEATDRRITIHS